MADGADLVIGGRAAVSVGVARTDVVILGAGLAGAAAALLLARRGISVAVVDSHQTYPADFRCEKFSTAQLALIENLGLSGCFEGLGSEVREVLVARGARVAGPRATVERCMRYDAMVNAVRRAWPETVQFIEDRVEGVRTSVAHQSVVLGGGHTLEARLLVVATGRGDRVKSLLGMGQRMIRQNQSMCFGFNIAPTAGGAFPFPALTYYGEKAGDGMAFAAIFPIPGGMRVNLFSYRAADHPWVKAFRAAPVDGLFAAMPGLRGVLGPVDVTSRIDLRVTHLSEALDYQRDGVVVIGDAYRLSCPVTGTGVTRVLTDVGQLAGIHAPAWLASPGMGREKIGAFYRDPVKIAADAHSAEMGEAVRQFATSRALKWRARRVAALVHAHALGMTRRLLATSRGAWALRRASAQRDAAGFGPG